MATISSYPNPQNLSLKGRSFEYVYRGSGMHGRVDFDDEKANWLILDGPNKGESGCDSYQAAMISPGVFFVVWHEPKDEITVVLTISEVSNHVFAAVVSPGQVEVDIAEFVQT